MTVLTAEPILPRRPADRRAPARKIGAIAVALLAFCVGALVGRAAETIPPAPANHFNDFAGVVPPATAAALNRELAQFERDTSNQIVVAIYPHMASNSSIEDYAVRVYQAWHIGQKTSNNGALLLIFSQDRRMRITTGYGLEGALPDALCKRILDDEIAPRFRTGDFAGGVTAGVHAMLAATRGEYRGTGRTAREVRSGDSASASPTVPLSVFLVIVWIVIIRMINNRRKNTLYTRSGRRRWNTPWLYTGSGGGNSGGWSSGGGSFDSGSFSGGGGSSGGGGASGSW